MTNRKRVNIKAVIADPVLREEIMEGATDFICKVEGIRRDPLSPAAQAVLNAANSAYDDAATVAQGTAAALRAAADLVAPDDYKCYTGNLEWDAGMEARTDDIRENILAIAAELENNG